MVAESLAVGRPVLISDQVNIWPEVQEEAVGLVDDDTPEGTERLLRHWLELLRPRKRPSRPAAIPAICDGIPQWEQRGRSAMHSRKLRIQSTQNN